jgi:hypothetical protein
MKNLLLAVFLTSLIHSYSKADQPIPFFPELCAVHVAGQTQDGAAVRKVCFGTVGTRGSTIKAIFVVAENGRHEVANYFRGGNITPYVVNVVFSPNYLDPDKGKLGETHGTFTVDNDFVTEAEGVTPRGTRFKAAQFVVP